MRVSINLKLYLCGIFFLQSAAARCLDQIPTSGLQETNFTVVIESRNWGTHKVLSNLLKIIVTEYMGVPTEFFVDRTAKRWDLVSSGDVMIDPEVWPVAQGHKVDQYINQQGTVENVGLLGVVTTSGWYVPTWLAKKYPQLTKWKGLLEPDMINLFKYKRDLTYDASLVNGTLLAGPASWVARGQQQRIRNLKLPYTIDFADNFNHWVERIETLMDAKKPFVGYMYIPSSLAGKYNFTRVELPPASDECYAKDATGGIDCEFPSQFLIKTSNINLNRLAPMTYQVLKSLSMSTEVMTRMSYELSYHNKTPYGLACEWLHENQRKWQRWVAPTFYLYENCPPGRQNIGTFVTGPDNGGRVTFCASCPAGQYSAKNNSKCMPCGTQSYSSQVGASSCKKCPSNSNTQQEGSRTIDECVCSKGYYRTGSSYDTLKCIACPEGATCAGGLASPSNKAEFWSNKSHPHHFRKCLHELACPAKLSPGQCENGYSGTLCGECDDGYFMAEGYCHRCSSKSISAIYTIFFWLIIITFVVGLAMATDLEKNRVVGRSGVAWKTGLIQTITYVQLLSVMGLGGSGPLASENFRAITGAFSVTNFNIEFFRLQCLFYAPWTTSYQLRALSSVLVFCCVVMSYAFVQKNSRYQAQFNTTLSVSFQILSIAIISFISSALEPFKCYEQPHEPGVYMAEKFPEIICYTSSEWRGLLPFTVLSLMVLVLVYPSSLCMILYKAPEESYRHNANFLEPFSPLFRPFKDDKYYWYLIIMARKVSISMLLSAVTLSRLTDSILAIVMLAFFMAMQIQYRPYFHNTNNTLAIIHNASLMLNGLMIIGSSATPKDSNLQTFFFSIYTISAFVSIAIGLIYTRSDIISFIIRERRIAPDQCQKFQRMPWQFLLAAMCIPASSIQPENGAIEDKIAGGFLEFVSSIRQSDGFRDIFSEQAVSKWTNAVCQDEILGFHNSLASLKDRHEWESKGGSRDGVEKRRGSITAHESFNRAAKSDFASEEARV